jgi:hypothetical protein
MVDVTHETFQDGPMWAWVVLEDGVPLCTGGMWPTRKQADADGANRAADLAARYREAGR